MSFICLLFFFKSFFFFNFLSISNNNNNFEIKIFLFIENLARILYSREGVQGTEAGGQGQGVVGWAL